MPDGYLSWFISNSREFELETWELWDDVENVCVGIIETHGNQRYHNMNLWEINGIFCRNRSPGGIFEAVGYKL